MIEIRRIESLLMKWHVSIRQRLRLLLALAAAALPAFTRHAAATLVHSFVSSCVDYCNALLAGAPKVTTDKLQRVMNAAARVITGTHKFDRGLSRILHNELRWLNVPERVTYIQALHHSAHCTVTGKSSAAVLSRHVDDFWFFRDTACKRSAHRCKKRSD